jgi:hypothetical protein
MFAFGVTSTAITIIRRRTAMVEKQAEWREQMAAAAKRTMLQ